jgi:hypothetical protein
VSRERYDEMKAMLEARLAAVEEDRRKILDHLQLQVVGEPIYAAPAPVKPRTLEPHEVINETQEQQRQNLVRRAMQATGSKSARVIAAWITKHNESEYRKLQEQPGAPEDVAMLLDEAVAQGRKNAEASIA